MDENQAVQFFIELGFDEAKAQEAASKMQSFFESQRAVATEYVHALTRAGVEGQDAIDAAIAKARELGREQVEALRMVEVADAEHDRARRQRDAERERAEVRQAEYDRKQLEMRQSLEARMEGRDPSGLTEYPSFKEFQQSYTAETARAAGQEQAQRQYNQLNSRAFSMKVNDPALQRQIAEAEIQLEQQITEARLELRKRFYEEQLRLDEEAEKQRIETEKALADQVAEIEKAIADVTVQSQKAGLDAAKQTASERAEAEKALAAQIEATEKAIADVTVQAQAIGLTAAKQTAVQRTETEKALAAQRLRDEEEWIQTVVRLEEEAVQKEIAAWREAEAARQILLNERTAAEEAAAQRQVEIAKETAAKIRTANEEGAGGGGGGGRGILSGATSVALGMAEYAAIMKLWDGFRAVTVGAAEAADNVEKFHERLEMLGDSPEKIRQADEAVARFGQSTRFSTEQLRTAVETLERYGHAGVEQLQLVSLLAERSGKSVTDLASGIGKFMEGTASGMAGSANGLRQLADALGVSTNELKLMIPGLDKNIDSWDKLSESQKNNKTFLEAVTQALQEHRQKLDDASTAVQNLQNKWTEFIEKTGFGKGLNNLKKGFAEDATEALDSLIPTETKVSEAEARYKAILDRISKAATGGDEKGLSNAFKDLDAAWQETVATGHERESQALLDIADKMRQLAQNRQSYIDATQLQAQAQLDADNKAKNATDAQIHKIEELRLAFEKLKGQQDGSAQALQATAAARQALINQIDNTTWSWWEKSSLDPKEVKRLLAERERLVQQGSEAEGQIEERKQATAKKATEQRTKAEAEATRQSQTTADDTERQRVAGLETSAKHEVDLARQKAEALKAAHADTAAAEEDLHQKNLALADASLERAKTDAQEKLNDERAKADEAYSIGEAHVKATIKDAGQATDAINALRAQQSAAYSRALEEETAAVNKAERDHTHTVEDETRRQTDAKLSALERVKNAEIRYAEDAAAARKQQVQDALANFKTTGGKDSAGLLQLITNESVEEEKANSEKLKQQLNKEIQDIEQAGDKLSGPERAAKLKAANEHLLLEQRRFHEAMIRQELEFVKQMLAINQNDSIARVRLAELYRELGAAQGELAKSTEAANTADQQYIQTQSDLANGVLNATQALQGEAGAKAAAAAASSGSGGGGRSGSGAYTAAQVGANRFRSGFSLPDFGGSIFDDNGNYVGGSIGTGFGNLEAASRDLSGRNGWTEGAMQWQNHTPVRTTPSPWDSPRSFETGGSVGRRASHGNRRMPTQSYPYYADGGAIGTDTQPAMLTDGEFVLTAKQVQEQNAQQERIATALDRLSTAPAAPVHQPSTAADRALSVISDHIASQGASSIFSGPSPMHFAQMLYLT